MKGKTIGAIISGALLAIYLYLVYQAIQTALCEPPCLARFTSIMASTMSVIGGLVSALVIAELALTKPGDAPLARFYGSGGPPGTAKLLISLYLLAWVAAGLTALLVSFRHDGLQALNDVGQSWLGLAAAAAYAYFGVKPST